MKEPEFSFDRLNDYEGEGRLSLDSPAHRLMVDELFEVLKDQRSFDEELSSASYETLRLELRNTKAYNESEPLYSEYSQDSDFSESSEDISGFEYDTFSQNSSESEESEDYESSDCYYFEENLLEENQSDHTASSGTEKNMN